MRTRSASLLCLALFLSGLSTGCRPFCGWQQYNCDTFGMCAFGTQPSYGKFAPPGPHPQPQYGAPEYGQPIAPGQTYGDPTFQGGGGYYDPSGATLGQPVPLQNQPSIESF